MCKEARMCYKNFELPSNCEGTIDTKDCAKPASSKTILNQTIDSQANLYDTAGPTTGQDETREEPNKRTLNKVRFKPACDKS